MIALLGSVVLAAATATPPPTIIRERVSPVCSTLHQLVVPLAKMYIKDKPIMAGIVAAQSRFAANGRTYLRDGQFLYAAKVDMLYTSIFQNFDEIYSDLNKSYAAYPQGTNAKVDALRQRVQNVVDLQRTLANNDLAAYAAFVDNTDVNGIQNSLNQLAGERADPHPGATPLPSDIVPFGTGGPGPSQPVATSPPPRLAADSDPRLSSVPPPGFAMRSLKWSRRGELTSLMNREGPALAAQALIAARDCDGG